VGTNLRSQGAHQCLPLLFFARTLSWPLVSPGFPILFWFFWEPVFLVISFQASLASRGGTRVLFPLVPLAVASDMSLSLSLSPSLCLWARNRCIWDPSGRRAARLGADAGPCERFPVFFSRHQAAPRRHADAAASAATPARAAHSSTKTTTTLKGESRLTLRCARAISGRPEPPASGA
jgi:hypothetical protein